MQETSASSAERRDRIRSLVRCGACGGELRDGGDAYLCDACGKVYPCLGEAVCFVSPQHAHPSVDRPDSFIVRLKNIVKRHPWLYRAFMRSFGLSLGGLSPKAFIDQYASAGAAIVTLGAGIERRRRNEIHVDLYAFPGIDMLADIRHLPFASDSVDAVIMECVLEHVDHPETVFAEIARILQPGGHCYLTAPFIYPYHSSPNDYFRFTMDGLRALGERYRLETVRAGVRHGATSALALQFAYWIAIPLSLGIRMLYEFWVILFTVLTMPLAHLFDLVFNRMRVSENAASGYYYVGRKRPPSV